VRIRTAALAISIVVAATTQAIADPFPTGAWKSIGPTTISDVYGLAAGRISDLVVETSGVIVVATANGGLWRRDPESGTWTAVGENLPTLSYGALDQSGSTFYAASGEQHWCYDCSPGRYVFSSGDDGRTWHVHSASPVTFASSIRVSPKDGKTLWLAGDRGLFLYSKDSSNSWTWKSVELAAGVPFDNPTSIALDQPRSPLRHRRPGCCRETTQRTVATAETFDST
jgi:hypothetical protein